MAKEFNHNVTRTEHKKFRKLTFKSFGKIYLVVRVYKDGSKVQHHHKRCQLCGLKYNNCAVNIEFGQTLKVICPVCKSGLI